jgi:hypothetical protein
MYPDSGDTVFVMTAAGVTVLIDASGPGLPVIAYWGPELPGLDATRARELLRANEPVTGTNNLDPRPRVAIIPEHRYGWTGRPGLSGSAAGTGWSPSFKVNTLATYAGGPLDANAETNRLVSNTEPSPLFADTETNRLVVNSEPSPMFADTGTQPVGCQQRTQPDVCRHRNQPVGYQQRRRRARRRSSQPARHECRGRRRPAPAHR